MTAKQLNRRVVFFDAAGTLLDLRENVGSTYSRLAARYGYHAEPERVEKAFRRTFRSREPLVNGTAERTWWKGVVKDAFNGASSFARFDEFFDETYEYFAHAPAWRLFEDVRPGLAALQGRGCKLAVISNWDSRLKGLLGELGIAEFFDGIFVSSQVGAAKPDPLIFEKALIALSCEATSAVHVGDSLSDDVEGALAAGIRAVWLDRHGDSEKAGVQRITTLLALAAIL